MSSEIRPLTTKERSLIQTFPESFDVSGPKSEMEQIIGNAVPVKLAEFVASRIAEYMTAQSHQYRDSCLRNYKPAAVPQVFEQQPEYKDHMAARIG